jgi:DNA polymerase-3 subunit gamma/tau
MDEIARLPDDALFVSVLFSRQPWSEGAVAAPDSAAQMSARLSELGFGPGIAEQLGLPTLPHPALPDPPAPEPDPTPAPAADAAVVSGAAAVPPVPDPDPGAPESPEPAPGADPMAELLARREMIQSLAGAPGTVPTDAPELGLAGTEALLEATRDARRLITELLGDPPG